MSWAIIEKEVAIRGKLGLSILTILIMFCLSKNKKELLKNLFITYIEKDLYLQGLLLELEKSRYFREKFTFKGGTCLTKAYFGYYRFSEDLDFTWIRQEDFKAKSEKAVRRMLSGEITQLLELYESAAKRLGLDFLPHKHERRYTEFGSSNRFATFKFWYKPIDSERETFIKIQLNFVEKIVHKPTKHVLNAIASEYKKEIDLLKEILVVKKK